ncbi:MAG: STAS domain-containing protein [Fibrella sp.]|nr:STAS domain-containing protein [Armatimonadota bacterium]
MATIDISVESLPENIIIVRVQGDKLDLSTAARFKDKMRDLIRYNVRMVLDLGAVQFVDSSGFGAILSCLRDINEHGGSMKICRVQKRVRALLELVRIHRILGIYDTSEEAVAAFDDATAIGK